MSTLPDDIFDAFSRLLDDGPEIDHEGIRMLCCLHPEHAEAMQRRLKQRLEERAAEDASEEAVSADELALRLHAILLGSDNDLEAEIAELCDAYPEREDAIRARVEYLRGCWSSERLLVRIRRLYGSSGTDSGVGLVEEDAGAGGGTINEESSPSARFVDLSKIDSGSFGVIHAVRDHALRRTFARKTLFPPSRGERKSESNARLHRFLEEAQVNAQLDHPNIVPVHDMGFDAEGRPFFTMKQVRGRTFKVVLALAKESKEGWSQTRGLEVLLKVCDALAFAHEKGVLHRDLKPKNVMVGAFGEVYVMDWGLARVLGKEDRHDLRIQPSSTITKVTSTRKQAADKIPESPILTMDGTVVGTPCYMPPEQALGKLEQLSPASDVYAVGAMIYELIVGRAPYLPAEGSVLPQTVLWEVTQRPPKPIHALVESVPVELEAICERAMARTVAERYPTMKELAEDLRAYLEHRVVQAYRTGALHELRKWVQRNRALAVSLSSALLILLAGVVVSWIFFQQADAASIEAAGSAQVAKANAEEAGRQTTIAKQNLRDVLDLSTIQILERLEREANEKLWPADLTHVPAMEDWLGRARKLDPVLTKLDGKLRELEAQAIPRSPEQIEADRRSHPEFEKLLPMQRRLAVLRCAEASASRASGELPEFDPGTLPQGALQIVAQMWPLLEPEQVEGGGVERALVLGRVAVEYASQKERAAVLAALAFASLASGRGEEAVRAMQAAVKASATDQLAALQEDLGLVSAAAKDPPAVRHDLERRMTALDQRVGQRREWVFAGDAEQSAEEKLWRYRLMTDLVGKLRRLIERPTVPEGTLGIWGSTIAEVERRAERTQEWYQMSLEDPEGVKAWKDAVAYAKDPAGPYGFDLVPREGLVPLLPPNPRTKLLEFWHVPSGKRPKANERWFWQGEEPPWGQVAEHPSRWIIGEETGMVLVLIPGGTFTMGAQREDPERPNYDVQALQNERPVRKVVLDAFLISKYETTQAQWRQLRGENPSFYQSGWGGTVGSTNPVEEVSWEDCDEFVRRWRLSLPTEAQWEYACRGGGQAHAAWSSGDDVTSLRGLANLADASNQNAGGVTPPVGWDDGFAVHAPVGHLRANRFGLHDMHGNVWEWCRDVDTGYELDPAPGEGVRLAPASQTAVAGASYRVIRGGCYALSAQNARSAFRSRGSPAGRDAILGLRPALWVARE